MADAELTAHSSLVTACPRRRLEGGPGGGSLTGLHEASMSRVGDGLAGIGQLHGLAAAHAEEPGQVAVGIETDRGLLAAALLAAGYQVCAVNPQVVSHYRGRHGSSRAKSDRGGAKVLADLVRRPAWWPCSAA